jgi:type I restriction enzyme S subunit
MSQPVTVINENLQTTFDGAPLPESWRRVRLSDICRQDRRIVEPRTPLAASLRYISLEHIESITGRILSLPSETITDRGMSTTFSFDTRHVLYGKLRPYLNKVALPDFAGRCTTELIPLLPTADVLRELLAWLLRRPQTVEAAMQQKTGARMPRANMHHILSLYVQIPTDIEEQRRIVAETKARLTLVEQAKESCYEQINLLNLYEQKTLSTFPYHRHSSKFDAKGLKS